jgi:hypothetical protein
MSCKTCKFWNEIPDYALSGHCQRYAPRAHVSRNSGIFETVMAHWPVTAEEDWCGEWIAIPKKSKKR